MEYSLTTRHLTLSETENHQVTEKLARLHKYLVPPFQMDVVISRDRHHQRGNVISCRVNLREGKRVLHAEREADTTLTAVDECVEALRQELIKAKNKQRRWRGGWRTLFGLRT